MGNTKEEKSIVRLRSELNEAEAKVRIAHERIAQLEAQAKETLRKHHTELENVNRQRNNLRESLDDRDRVVAAQRELHETREAEMRDMQVELHDYKTALQKAKSERDHYKSGADAGDAIITFLNRNWHPDALPFLRGIVHMCQDNLRTMAEELPFFDGRETTPLETKVIAEVTSKGKIPGIKLYRETTKASLKDAKEWVEALMRKQGIDEVPRTF